MNGALLVTLILACFLASRSIAAEAKIEGYELSLRFSDQSAFVVEEIEQEFERAADSDVKLAGFLSEREAPYKAVGGGRYDGRNVERITISSSISRKQEGFVMTTLINEKSALYVTFNVGHRLGADRTGGFFIVFDVSAIQKREYKNGKDDVGTIILSSGVAKVLNVTKVLDVKQYSNANGKSEAKQ